MYSLIASDLDGTLLLPGDRIGDYTCSILQQLHLSGRHLVFATGRHQADVRSLLGRLQAPVHLITSNGACISSACGNLQWQRSLDSDLVRALLATTRDELQLVINAYGPSRWLMNQPYPDLHEFNQSQTFRPSLCAVDHFALQGVEKMFFFHHHKDHAALLLLQARLEARFGTRISCVFSFPWCLEVMAAQVTKGHALQQLARFLGIADTDCLAFGDAMNDVEMLAGVGRGVLMGTAHEQVRRALPAAELIGSCQQEAVARYLAATLLDKSGTNRAPEPAAQAHRQQHQGPGDDAGHGVEQGRHDD